MRPLILVLISFFVVTPHVTRPLLPTSIKNFVLQPAQDYGMDMIFWYMRETFQEYQKHNPIKYTGMKLYIPGKSLYADINRRYAGETMLHHAIMLQDVDLVAILLFFGANAHLQNQDGITPLQLAKNLQLDSILYLLEMYAKNQIKDPLMLGCFQASAPKTMASQLLEFCSPLIAISALHSLAESIKISAKDHPIAFRMFMLAIRGYTFDQLINNQSAYHATFLQKCIEFGDVDFAQMLLYFGADPLCGNRNNYNALDAAIDHSGDRALSNASGYRVAATSNDRFVKMFWPYCSYRIALPAQMIMSQQVA